MELGSWGEAGRGGELRPPESFGRSSPSPGPSAALPAARALGGSLRVPAQDQETPRGPRPLGEPQTPAVTAVPMFPRARHSSACGGGGEEVRALPAAQLNSGGPYRDAPPSHLLRPLPGEEEIEELQVPVLFDRGLH